MEGCIEKAACVLGMAILLGFCSLDNSSKTDFQFCESKYGTASAICFKDLKEYNQNK